MVQKLAHNQLIHSPAFGRWLRSYDVCVAVISDGTVYRDGFDSDLIDILETARLTETPLCIYWGNLETGEIWDGLPGYVGRSAGLKKVPLCVKTKRSRGGGEIMPAILRITTSEGVRVLYTHDNHTNQ